jgi:hypothetical protein
MDDRRSAAADVVVLSATAPRVDAGVQLGDSFGHGALPYVAAEPAVSTITSFALGPGPCLLVYSGL